MQNRITVYDLVSVGLLAALVFAASLVSIPIPTIAGVATRLHLGNVCCLLSALLLGRWRGGLAAGIGSAFFDLTNPLYVASMPFTLVFKFLMAFICGTVAFGSGTGSDRASKGRATIGAASGALAYVILYLGRHFITDIWFLGESLQVALIDVGQRAVVSLLNGGIAVVVAVPLSFALHAALKRIPFYQKITH